MYSEVTLGSFPNDSVSFGIKFHFQNLLKGNLKEILTEVYFASYTTNMAMRKWVNYAKGPLALIGQRSRGRLYIR
jgi:hypothetical protein